MSPASGVPATRSSTTPKSPRRHRSSPVDPSSAPRSRPSASVALAIAEPVKKRTRHDERPVPTNPSPTGATDHAVRPDPSSSALRASNAQSSAGRGSVVQEEEERKEGPTTGGGRPTASRPFYIGPPVFHQTRPPRTRETRTEQPSLAELAIALADLRVEVEDVRQTASRNAEAIQKEIDALRIENARLRSEHDRLAANVGRLDERVAVPEKREQERQDGLKAQREEDERTDRMLSEMEAEVGALTKRIGDRSEGQAKARRKRGGSTVGDETEDDVDRAPEDDNLEQTSEGETTGECAKQEGREEELEEEAAAVLSRRASTSTASIPARAPSGQFTTSSGADSAQKRKRMIDATTVREGEAFVEKFGQRPRI